MLLKIFEITFDKLIGRLDQKQKDKARALFCELMLALAEGAAKGAVNGVRS